MLKYIIYKRDYSKFNKTQLVNEVSQINWETIFTSNNDLSDMFNKVYTKISDIIDKHLPLKKISRRELMYSTKPWITLAIKASINIKNQLYKKYLKN